MWCGANSRFQKVDPSLKTAGKRVLGHHRNFGCSLGSPPRIPHFILRSMGCRIATSAFVTPLLASSGAPRLVASPMSAAASRPRRARAPPVRYAATASPPSSPSDHGDCDFEPTKEGYAVVSPASSTSGSPPPSKRPRTVAPNASTDTDQHYDYSADARRAVSSLELSRSESTTLRQRLLSWYSVHHREFPWRVVPAALPFDARAHLASHLLSAPARPKSEAGTDLPEPGSAYAVLVSEMMSQQTRIEVVVRYYTAWMRRFPTISALAAASLDDVYAAWAGLGYYRRARFLHEAACQVSSHHDGIVPRDPVQVRRLKGVGDYTTGALLSIAFGEEAACADGNIERVVSRLRPAIGSIAMASARRKAVSLFLDGLVKGCVTDDALAPGDLNQSLIDIGATVCKPAKPECSKCPLQDADMCGAYAMLGATDTGRAEIAKRFPNKTARKKTKVHKQLVAAIVAFDTEGRLLLTKRQRKENDNDLLSGLWEVVNVVDDAGEEADKGGNIADMKNHRVLAKLMSKLTIKEDGKKENNNVVDVSKVAYCGKVTHIFSHIKQVLDVYTLHMSGYNSSTESDTDTVKWIALNDVEDTGISTQMKKVIAKAVASCKATKVKKEHMEV